MLVEIHMIQNHAPSNLNRDDTGSPKDCVFGGIRRARISSQCLKRSIRLSSLFSDGLAGTDLGVRTRRLPQQVRDILVRRGVAPEMADLAADKASGFGNKEGKEQKDAKTAQMMFLSPRDIEAVAAVLYDAIQGAESPAAFRKVTAKELQAKAELRGWRPITPDIALFGRMITSEAFRDVEASVQVAHALSTNKMDHEFDYFTAVDDLQGAGDAEEDAGAGMIGDVEFNSACYYKYFSIDPEAMVANLAGPKPGSSAAAEELAGWAAAESDAKRIAIKSVLAFLRAAIFTTPSGKQNTFAAHQLPDAILIEVRQQKTPVSYANAFIQPVRAQGDTDLMAGSIARLAAHVELLTRKFSLEAAPRLWFTTRDVELSGASRCDTADDLFTKLEEAVATGVEANG